MMLQFSITKSKQTHLAKVIKQSLTNFSAPPVSYTLNCSLSLIYFLHQHTYDMGHWSVQLPSHRTLCPLYYVPLLIIDLFWPVLLGGGLTVQLPHFLEGVILKPSLTIDTPVNVGLEGN